MKGRWQYIALLLGVFVVLRSVASAQWNGQTFQMYSLRHAEPGEVRRMLEDLLGDNPEGVRIFADSEKKQLVVSGGDAAQQLAVQLIKQVDRPAAARAPLSESPVLESYSVPANRLEQSLVEIRRLVGDDARIAVNRVGGMVLVMATPTQHQAIQYQLGVPLQQADGSISPADGSIWPSREPIATIKVADSSEVFPRTASPSRDAAVDSASVQLRYITVKQCQHALEQLLGDSLSSFGDAQYRYDARRAGTVVLAFDTESQVCRVSGNKAVVSQFVLLMRQFEDSQNDSTGEAFHFVPLKTVRPDVLNRAIKAWKESTGSKETIDGADGGDPLRRMMQVRPTGFVQQSEGSTSGNDPIGGGQNAAAQLQPNDRGLQRPSSDVTVQPLPDLDVLILRGRDPDVEELVRIIQEIERLSDETAPEIEVYHLKHVKGAALQALITEVMDDLTGPLQGRISITPLEKPNALLLIGWGEAVKAAKQLIQKLDRSVSPATQMKVFPLSHAPAGEMSDTISQFLNERGGLGPDVTITSNPRTNSLIVHASPRDMEEVTQLIQRLDVGSSASVNQAKMVRLKNSLAADVAATISAAITAARGGGAGSRSAALQMLLIQPGGEKVVASGLLDNVTLTPDPRTNSIFITGPAESIPLVEQLIQQIDESPAASAQIKVFQIANGDASDLVVVLRSLFPAAATTSTVPQLASAEGETSLVPVRFSVDIRTNTIIATGTEGDLRIIEALLLRLDQSESEERVNRVYRLKNSPATDVAQAVNDFLRSERIVSQAAPGRANPFQQIKHEVVVVPEPVRNSLIISATPRYFEQIMQLVEDLDDQPPQVMIQVILAEIDLDNFHEFGVELGLQDSLLFDRSLLGDLLTTVTSSALSTPAGVVTTTTENIVGATNTPGFDFNNNPLGNSGSTQSRASSGTVAGQALSTFSLGRVNSDLEYGGLVLSASSENVSVMLRALDHSGCLEVLSRPQVMTLDNQQAFIQVGQRVPRVVSSQLTQLGQINTLALEDVGLLLGVTPRISPEGHVVMEIDAEKSKVGPEREGIPISVTTDGAVIRSPRVDVTTAQTTVSAASGQTIVIGGLISNVNQSISRRIPWLSDLPVLGHLFGYESFKNRRTELLIILTPHVILGQSEAEYVKQVEMSRMSWVSSDVFEWLDGDPSRYGTFDDQGVPVIYPDEAPDPSFPLSPDSHPGDPGEIPPLPGLAPGQPSEQWPQPVPALDQFDHVDSEVSESSLRNVSLSRTSVSNANYSERAMSDGVAHGASRQRRAVDSPKTGPAQRRDRGIKPKKKAFFGWSWGTKG
jgi:general secretion pathway protein D